MKKKLLSILLATLLLLTCIPLGAVSVSAATYGDLTYVISDNEVTITVSNPSISGKLTIPSTIEGYPVTAIGNDAFYNRDKLTEVVIPDNVTSIGASAFNECTNLVSVTIGKEVVTIGESAFENCVSLTKVTIPDNVITISDYAFFSCDGLTTVNIGNGVKNIGKNVFSWCSNLSKVTISNNVVSISNAAFLGCIGLISVTIPDSVTIIEDWAFAYCNNLTSVNIPDSITAIGSYAFQRCYSLTDVWYTGTKEQANAIDIGEENEKLLSATWHYNYTPLAITKEPTTGYAQMGKKVKVTVEAEGDGLTYVWRVKNAGASKYSASSITSNTYSVTMSDKTKNRRVFCYVYDQYGNMVQSKSVLLREAVSVVAQPQNTKVAEGEKAKVTVKASGDGLTYTWYVKNEGASKYTKSSVTKSTYSVTMSDKVHMRLLYCVVTDKYGNTVKTEKVRLRMQ